MFLRLNFWKRVKSMPRWIHERRNEHYYNKAKEEGYRSRASYKLKQLDDEYHFFRGAHNVLDLGAAPGGWLQVASSALNGGGLIIGVDLKEIIPLDAENIETIVGDATSLEVKRQVIERFGGKADVILSDMAPNVTGIWDVDDYRQIHLARSALSIADLLLKDDGWMVIKVFQGIEYDNFFLDVRNMFEEVHVFKPKASRKSSAEIYIVTKNLKSKRILPEEFRGSVSYQPPQEKDKGPIPGDQLPQEYLS
jgi:23S rRNA (uridine2552-2'-O)-methyltransferase